MSSNNDLTDILGKTMDELRHIQELESERRRKENQFLNHQLQQQTHQSENQRKNERENYQKDQSLLIDVTRQNTMVQQHQLAQFQTQINNLHISYNAQLSDMKARWDRDVAELKSQLQNKNYEIENLRRDVSVFKQQRNEAYLVAEEVKSRKNFSKQKTSGGDPFSYHKVSSRGRSYEYPLPGSSRTQQPSTGGQYYPDHNNYGRNSQ